MVWVSHGILPATIKVMPKSPRARQNASVVPAITDRHANGSVTDQKIFHSERPSVLAACSSRRSTDSIPAWAALTSSAMEPTRSEEHTSELQSRGHLVCRLLLEKK